MQVEVKVKRYLSHLSTFIFHLKPKFHFQHITKYVSWLHRDMTSRHSWQRLTPSLHFSKWADEHKLRPVFLPFFPASLTLIIAAHLIQPREGNGNASGYFLCFHRQQLVHWTTSEIKGCSAGLCFHCLMLHSLWSLLCACSLWDKRASCIFLGTLKISSCKLMPQIYLSWLLGHHSSMFWHQPDTAGTEQDGVCWWKISSKETPSQLLQATSDRAMWTVWNATIWAMTHGSRLCFKVQMY